MSRADVEIVRTVLTAGRSEAAGVIADLLDPAVHLDLSQRAADPGVFDGYQGISQWRAEVNDVWDSYWMEPQQLLDGADGVVAITRERGRDKGSGVEMDREIAFVFRVRAGRVHEIRYHVDREQALSDARCEVDINR